LINYAHVFYKGEKRKLEIEEDMGLNEQDERKASEKANKSIESGVSEMDEQVKKKNEDRKEKEKEREQEMRQQQTKRLEEEERDKKVKEKKEKYKKAGFSNFNLLLIDAVKINMNEETKLEDIIKVLQDKLDEINNIFEGKTEILKEINETMAAIESGTAFLDDLINILNVGSKEMEQEKKNRIKTLKEEIHREIENSLKTKFEGIDVQLTENFKETLEEDNDDNILNDVMNSILGMESSVDSEMINNLNNKVILEEDDY
jgi:hypothetical protein